MNQTSPYNKSKTFFIIAALIVIVALGIALYFAWPFISAFGNPDKIRYMIDKAGAWAP